jgi:hypothetical protein
MKWAAERLSPAFAGLKIFFDVFPALTHGALRWSPARQGLKTFSKMRIADCNTALHIYCERYYKTGLGLLLKKELKIQAFYS